MDTPLQSHPAAMRWHVVQTQPLQERRAVQHLQRQDYHIFWPSYRRTIRHARRSSVTLVPLFPGYLFLRLEASHDRWRRINGTRGVVRLLTQGDVPQVLPHGVIEALQAEAGPDGIMNRQVSLHVGETVRILQGPFTDLPGRLERLDAAGRVCVLLDLLGRSVRVDLSRDAVSPAA